MNKYFAMAISLINKFRFMQAAPYLLRLSTVGDPVPRLPLVLGQVDVALKGGGSVTMEPIQLSPLVSTHAEIAHHAAILVLQVMAVVHEQARFGGS